MCKNKTINRIICLLLVICMFAGTAVFADDVDANAAYQYTSDTYTSKQIKDLFFENSSKYNPELSTFAVETLQNLKPKGFKLVYEHQPINDDPYAVSTDIRLFLFKKTVIKNLAKYDIYLLYFWGSEGTSEWLSNFAVGQSEGYELHKGFSDTAEFVYDELKDNYFSKHPINKCRTKMLISGHSRGAAVANLLAAKYMDQGVLRKKDLYVYTFACPNYSLRLKYYSNIFNICNIGDMVPKMPVLSWGYHKEGNLIILPVTVKTLKELDAELKEYQREHGMKEVGYNGLRFGVDLYVKELADLIKQYDLLNPENEQIAIDLLVPIIEGDRVKIKTILDFLRLLKENGQIDSILTLGLLALLNVDRIQASHVLETYLCWTKTMNQNCIDLQQALRNLL